MISISTWLKTQRSYVFVYNQLQRPGYLLGGGETEVVKVKVAARYL